MTPLDLIAKACPSAPQAMRALIEASAATEAVDWIEQDAYQWCTGAKCDPPTLIRGWNGTSTEVRHCTWCGQTGTSA